MAKSTYIPPRDWTPEQVQAVAKLSWEMLDFMEGNCYVEVCPECRVASMHHQQT